MGKTFNKADTGQVGRRRVLGNVFLVGCSAIPLGTNVPAQSPWVGDDGANRHAAIIVMESKL